MVEVSQVGPAGSLVALPPAITAGAGELARVAGDAAAVRGQLASVASAGCGPEAMSAYEHMNTAWLGELGRLCGSTGDVASKLTAAAGSYQTTDATAIPGGGG